MQIWLAKVHSLIMQIQKIIRKTSSLCVSTHVFTGSKYNSAWILILSIWVLVYFPIPFASRRMHLVHCPVYFIKSLWYHNTTIKVKKLIEKLKIENRKLKIEVFLVAPTKICQRIQNLIITSIWKFWGQAFHTCSLQ